MKRAGMGWLSILFLFIGIGTAFGAIAAYLSNGEQVGDGTIVLGVIAVVTYIVFRVLWSKAKWRCKCGTKGRAINAEYLGSDIKWTDSSDGKSSARRVTKKYLVTCACPKCGSQWSFKTTKAGPTDTYKY